MHKVVFTSVIKIWYLTKITKISMNRYLADYYLYNLSTSSSRYQILSAQIRDIGVICLLVCTLPLYVFSGWFWIRFLLILIFLSWWSSWCFIFPCINAWSLVLQLLYFVFQILIFQSVGLKKQIYSQMLTW